MKIFLLAAAIMFAIAFWLVLTPLLRKREYKQTTIRDKTNLDIGRERLRELKADLKAGRIDKARFEVLREELELTLLDAIKDQDESAAQRGQQDSISGQGNNLWLVLVLTLSIPVIALGIYNEVGDTSFLQPRTPTKPRADQAPDIEGMVQGLADRLEENPEDGQGWQMLGRSYLLLQRYSDSARAYKKAYEILGENAELLINYADAIGRSNNNDLTGEAKPLIKRSLELGPDNAKSQWMAGMLAYQELDYKKALAHLEPLLNQMEAESEARQGMVMLIDRIKAEQQQLSGESDQLLAAQPSSESRPESEPQGAAIQISVSLDETLLGKVGENDVVFIFAKAVSGPPMPLAIAKLKAADLPMTVILDDSMAMRPDLTISSHEKVDLIARISKSGNAIATAGDLQGEVENISTFDQKPYHITINEQLN